MSRKQRQKIAKKRIKQYAEQSSKLSTGRRFRNAPVEHSKRGRIVFGISLGMIVAYIGLLTASFLLSGQLSEYYGSAGVLAMIISVVCMIEALISRKERRSFKLFPNLATASSLIACICWIGTFALGAAY